MKKWIYSVLCVLGATIIAILVHALVPSPGATVNVADFDGFLVRRFGFPFVASAYFIILYLHILFVILYFGSKSSLSKNEIAWRYGLAFGLIYLMGMQEVVVEGSPLKSYGIDFILFQLVMGLGDAVPVVLLCRFVTRLIPEDKKLNEFSRRQFRADRIITVIIITVLFMIERVIGYKMGYIDSDIKRYPVPVLIWTLLFGITLGCCYLLIRPSYNNRKSLISATQIIIVSLGLNWIWFNSFMGLLLKGTIGQMLLRSGVDVVVMFIGTWIVVPKIKRIRGEMH